MAYVVELNMLMSTKQRVTKRTILDDQLMMMMMKMMKMLLMMVMVIILLIVLILMILSESSV